MSIEGELYIRVKQARLTRDTEFFGKMDPFVEIEIGELKQRTATHKNAGKHPAWDE